MDGTPKREYHAPTVGVDRVVITEGIEVRPGVPLTIVTERDPVDPISRDLASGVYSPPYDRMLQLLQTIVPVGGRVLDLGAHIGTFSLAAAALGYEVLAVEASPRNAALLQASIEANEFHQMRLIHAAVSDRSGSLEFCAHGPWGHVSTGHSTIPTVRVPAVTVEQILDDHGWDRVDFVKIDIEGSEVAALEGMKQLLSGPDSPPLFVESNGHTLNFFDQTPDTLKKTLKQYGYQAFLVEHERLVPVKEGELQPYCCVDLLALKRRPVGLRVFRIDRPLSHSETIARVLYSCRAENPAERWYIARELRTASRSIRGHKEVIQAVSALRRDPDMSIRDAAAKVCTGDSGMSRWFICFVGSTIPKALRYLRKCQPCIGFSRSLFINNRLLSEEEVVRPFSTEDLAGLTLGKGVQWREHEELPFGRSLLLSKEGSFVSIRARRGTLRVAFLRHPWSGRAEVRIGRQDHVVDLYLSETRNQVVEFLCEEESGCVVISSVGRAPKSPAKGSEVWIHTFEWVDTGSDTEIFTAWKNETCSIVQGYEGDFLTLNNDTAISQTLREKGIWAPQDTDLFKKLIKPGMVVADIGANSGHHSVVFSKAVGPSGLVIACEPQRIFFELLSANLILNRCQNVIPVHCALGAESRRLRLWPIDYSQPNNFGALGVSQEGGEPLLDHSGEEVDVVTADDLLGRVLPAGRKVDFLKIDVQTFELFVLRGAERVLNQMRPVIFTEISPFWMRKTGYDYREIYDLLSRYSYQVYDPHVSLEVQAAVREWSGDQQEEWDILAVPGIRVSP